MALKLTHYTVQGRNGPGAISVPGVAVGDVIGLIFYNDFGFIMASHEPLERVVTVNNQVQQTALIDLSATLPFHIYTIS